MGCPAGYDWFVKILVLGDLHNNYDWFVVRVLPYALKHKVDKIMQVGDCGLIWGSVGALDRVSKALVAADLDMHFLPGNHEDHDYLEELCIDADLSPEGHFRLAPRVLYTGRVCAWEWAGRRCAAVGGATSIDREWRVPGESWWPQEALTAEEAEVAKTIGTVEILFTHDAPTQNPFSLRVDHDSLAHRQLVTDVARVLRPRNWYHGHYHTPATYTFDHADGYAIVVSLGCDDSPMRFSSSILDLNSVPCISG